MAGEKRLFHWRGWTTLVVTISFVVDTVSGVILYIAPPGRVEKWLQWKVWGLSKDQWIAVHTIFGYVLLVIVAVHLYYNWKVFTHYLWRKAQKALNLKWELALSVLFCLLLFLGSVWNLPPFSTVMAIGEHFKAGWEKGAVKAPVSRSESKTLQEFAGSIQVPVEQMTGILKSRGYAIENNQQKIEEIAKANQTSPSKLYEELQAGGAVPVAPKTGEGSGLGRKSLKVVAEEQGLSLEQVLSRLKALGVEAQPDDRLRDVAGKLGKTPTETLDLLKGR